MLDKVTANLLSVINEQCKDNNYIVLKDDDILPHLVKKNKLTGEGVKDTIAYLAEREYIKLKYSEEGTYCLTMLPKGRLFQENDKESKYHINQEKKRNVKFLVKVSFLSALFAFLGAVAGFVIVYQFFIR